MRSGKFYGDVVEPACFWDAVIIGECDDGGAESFRDGDAEATAQVSHLTTAPPVTVPFGLSPWPFITAVSAILLVVGLALLAGAQSWVLLGVSLALLSFGQGVASPSLTTMVSDYAPPARRGEAMGYQQSAGAIGRIVGPPMAGWMFDHVGEWSPYVLGAGLSAAALLLLLGWGIHRPADGAAVTPSAH
jgi:MFS family permease